MFIEDLKKTYGRVEAEFDHFSDQRGQVVLGIRQGVVHANNYACLTQSTNWKTIWW
jgi:hypothetical protein